jgi:hypothetical protein
MMLNDIKKTKGELMMIENHFQNEMKQEEEKNVYKIVRERMKIVRLIVR